MELSTFELSEYKIAEVVSDEIAINTTRDALDLTADAQYRGADCLISYEKHLPTAFFDLKTGMAGEIL